MAVSQRVGVVRAAPPLDGRTLPERFAARVRSTPDGIAYWAELAGRWEPTTWERAAHLASAFGTGLAELGHRPGDAVAILGPTRPEWTISDLGAIGIGAPVVGVYPTLTPEGIGYILGHSGATTLVVSGEEHLDAVLAIEGGMPRVDRIIAWDAVNAALDGRILTYDAVLATGDAVLADDPDRFVHLGEHIAPQDVAIIVYTSGTTGPPKGAPLTHANITPVMDAMAECFPELGPDDVTVAFLPLAHVAGHVLEQFGRIQIGFSAFYCPDIKLVLDVFAAARPTLFGSVPRLYEKVLGRVEATMAEERGAKRRIGAWGLRTGIEAARARREGRTLPPPARAKLAIADRLVLSKVREAFGGRCRLFIVGAAPIAFEVLEFCEGIGIPIYEVYGMTETASLMTLNRPGEVRLGSVGRVMPGGLVRLDEDGEILFKGPNVFPGYLDNPKATAETITPDGWLRSGDIGRIDVDGYLWIVDRKKDLIVTAGGKNVAPSNIENLLRQIPLVGEVLVHGDRRKYLTALLSMDIEALDRFASEHALAALDQAQLFADEHLREHLQQHIDAVNERLAAYERLRRWEIAPEAFSIGNGLLTPTLKVKRREVERRYADLLDALYPRE